MALAYLITFTTYGTWLHGGDKGNGSVDRQHNVHGTPFLEPDAEREARDAGRMTERPYAMGEVARVVVQDAIVALCAERGWSLLALHVRTSHVHGVVAADREPGRLMSEWKARASRELNRLAVDTQIKRWTRHGSTRHLFTEASVWAAISYTLDQQGPPMARYDPRDDAR